MGLRHQLRAGVGAQQVAAHSGEDHRFLLRAEQGAIIGDSFSLVPPSLRFFTGGDQTVRGYGYETISPRGSDGKLLGAAT